MTAQPQGLGFASAGDFLPYLNFTAKAGKFFFCKDKGQTELLNPAFLIDFSKIQTGWLYFATGQAPQSVWHPSLTVKTPRPEGVGADGKALWKEGFKVVIFSQTLFGGMAEFSSSSQIVRDAVNELYLAYLAGIVANPGAVPVIQVSGTTPIKSTANGITNTNYKPVWSIAKWVPKPAEMDGAPSNANASVAAAAPAPVAASASEF